MEVRAAGAASRLPAWVPIAVVAAVIVAYLPAIRAPFQFDDIEGIVNNSSIRQLWPVSVPLHAPAELPTAGRPIANYSLAINNAVNEALGLGPVDVPGASLGFHVGNVALHLACGALLFGTLRRTLRRQRFDPGFAGAADPVAAGITAVWLVHPIHSEAVNYLTQRTEILVAFFYLATLYAAIRAWDASSPRSRAVWSGLAVVACLLGMGTKEVMIAAPLAVILYDRAFHFDRWRAAFADRRRGVLWIMLTLTSIWSIWLISGAPRSKSVGFDLGTTWYEYLIAQGWAIPHYVRLVLWPDQLTVDYGQQAVGAARGTAGLVVLTVLGVATVIAWMRADRWGWLAFLGSWFFMVLAPSSSFVPITTEIAAERRIYLALPAVLVAVAVGVEALRRRVVVAPPAARDRLLAGAVAVTGIVYLLISGWKSQQIALAMLPRETTPALGVALTWLVRVVAAAATAWGAWIVMTRRRPGVAVLVIAVILAITTFGRSRTFADVEALWRDAVTKYPGNLRAYSNLAVVLTEQQPSRRTEAESWLRRAVTIDSSYLPTLYQLALLQMQEDSLAEAARLLERVLARDAAYGDAGETLGKVYVELGQADRGIPHLERAATPPTEASLIDLAIAYRVAERPEDAIRTLARAHSLNPARVETVVALADLLLKQGRPGDAARHLEEVLRVSPDDPPALTALGDAKAALGDRPAAIRLYEQAARVAPDYVLAKQRLQQIKGAPR